MLSDLTIKFSPLCVTVHRKSRDCPLISSTESLSALLANHFLICLSAWLWTVWFSCDNPTWRRLAKICQKRHWFKLISPWHYKLAKSRQPGPRRRRASSVASHSGGIVKKSWSKFFTDFFQGSNNKIRKIISNKPNFDHVQLKIRPLSTSLNQKLNNYHVPFGVMTVGWYGIVPPNPLLSSSVSSHGRDWNKSKSFSRTPFAEKIKCRRVVVTVVVWP